MVHLSAYLASFFILYIKRQKLKDWINIEDPVGQWLPAWYQKNADTNDLSSQVQIAALARYFQASESTYRTNVNSTADPKNNTNDIQRTAFKKIIF